jgi:hypothetical protein
MPAAGLGLLALAAVVLAATARLRASLIALLTTTFLVPDTIVVPGTTGYLPVGRLVLWAFVGGVVVRAWHNRELDRRAFRFGRVHAAFAVFLIVAFAAGVAAAPAGSHVKSSATFWLLFSDQLLFLVAVTAAARVLGPWTVARLAAVFATAAAAIALVEHFTGGSWARWWFSDLERLRHSVAAQPLEPRGGGIRVRAAAQYSLAFGWSCAMLLPLVTVVAIRARRRVALLAPAAVAVAMLWTFSRSAPLGVILGVGLLVVLCADRTIVRVAVVGAALAVVVFGAVPSLRAPLVAARSTDSVSSRELRLSQLTSEVAARPYTGLGFDGLATRGMSGIDTSYMFVYATTGVLGMLAFVTLLGGSLTGAVATAMSVRGRDRALAAAAAGGLAAGIVGTAAFDQFSTPASANVFWLLAAIALACRPAGVRSTERGVSPARLVAVPLGAALGLAVLLATPTHTALTFRTDLIAGWRSAAAGDDQMFPGRVLAHTACDVMRPAAQAVPHVTYTCRDLRMGPGVAEVRLVGRDEREVMRAARGTGAMLVGTLPSARAWSVGDIVTARPTAARVAPVAGAWLAALIAALAPSLRRRQTKRRLSSRATRRARLAPAATPVALTASTNAARSLPVTS